MYEGIQVLHVLAAVIWVGGAFALQVLGFNAQRSDDSSKMIALARDAEFIGTRVFFPASVAVLVFGIVMVIDSPAWTFGQLWIVFALVITAISAIVGMAYFGPESGRVAKLTEEHGAEHPDVVARIKRIFLVSRIELLLLLAVVADMVAKPGI
jgi:uncharacterized membrane protein